MARYSASLETRLSPAACFAYLSDMSNAAEWDPGIAEAEKMTDGPVRVNSTFRLATTLLGRKITGLYRVTSMTPPSEITFQSETTILRAQDAITIEKTREGSRITYNAILVGKGPLGVLDPALGLVFRRTTARTLAGLKRHLASLAREEHRKHA
ncbi:MAG: SRPBCC family protein [Actinomycetota bacterium]